MKRLWPWSRGAPTEPSDRMVEDMSPHPEAEGEAYDSAGATRAAGGSEPRPAEPAAPSVTVRESLFRAAKQLDDAAEAYRPDHEWQLQARRAVRASIVAVERHLDTTFGSDGLADEVIHEEPRLLPAIERLEADLARVLIQLWEADYAASTERPAFVQKLRGLAGAVRAAGAEEFTLLHEFFNEPGAVD